MSNHTPGPWRWEYSEATKRMNLCGGKHPYDLTVMDFVRLGMSGACPRFRTPADDGNLMVRAEEYAVIKDGREHHSSWFKVIRHPDADLIAASPLMFDRLVQCVRELSCMITQNDIGPESSVSVAHNKAMELIKSLGGLPQ